MTPPPFQVPAPRHGWRRWKRCPALSSMSAPLPGQQGLESRPTLAAQLVARMKNPLEQRLRSSPKRSPGLLRPSTYARLQRRRRLHRLSASHVREKLPLPLCPRQPRRLSNVEHPQPSLLSPRGPLLPAHWQAVVGHRETKVRPLNLEPASRRRPDQGRQSQPSDRNGWRWQPRLLLLPLRWPSPGARRIFLRSFRFLWISFRTLLQRS